MLPRIVSIPTLVCLALLIPGTTQSQTLSWSNLNSANRSNIQSLLVLSSGAIIAGDDSGCVIRFDVGGAAWSRFPVTSSPSPFPPTVAALSIHPNGHLFTTVGVAVYTSVDGGEHWTPVTPTGNFSKPTLACTPGGTLLSGGRVVNRSLNEGATWSVSLGPSGDYTSLLVYDPANLFVGSSRGVYRSSNDGATWEVADSAFRTKYVRALARGIEGRLYAATDSGAYFSADTGRTWIYGSGLSAATAICALSSGHVLAGDGMDELFKSTDGGLTWTSVGSGPVVNPRCLSTETGGEAAAGAIDGLYKSINDGSGWTKLGFGLTGARLTAVGATSARVTVSTKDSLIYYASFGGPWSRATDAPTGTEVQSLVGVLPTAFLAGTSGAGIYRSIDGGATWGAVNTGLSNLNVHVIIMLTPTLLFAGTDDGVFRSLDTGKTWSTASSGLPAIPVRALGALTGTPLYAGTQGGGIFRSTDDGASWTSANAGLTSLDIRSLLVVPGGSVLAGAEGTGIFFLNDAGSSWSLATTGIPDFSIRSMAATSNRTVFAASPSGVFKANAPGSAWVADTAGLPASGPTALALVLDQFLLCSTDGFGLYVASTEPASPPQAPVTNWMSVGSLHNWFSSMGCEMEEGRSPEIQDGARWPAIMPRQDMQASRALWIGTTNYTDPFASFYPRKVVHVGPRVAGTGEFIPISFVTTSKFDPPAVFVNGTPSQLVSVTNDVVNPALVGDRVIANEVNTALGISMRRRILQFSHPLHDNYIVQEYEFTNTGNTDADPFIEQPGVTLDSVYFFFLNRWAICADVRPVIGNATGWGINTMLDGRGDGVMVDPPQEQFRTQFAWHGKYPLFSLYDNIGGPIWYPYVPFHGAADTIGRLGSPQFSGIVTLHADASPTNHADDPSQPSTTSWEDSDAPETSQNSQFNNPKMVLEYNWMRRGHKSPRHAWQVEPTGDFDQPTGDPARGTSGGFSAATGYGPHRMFFGDTVRIVIAEGSAGLSQEKRSSIGRLFKQGVITARAKNDSVLTGKDSLFQTFRRALANYGSGYNIASPPYPPREVQVRSGNPIEIDWQVFGTGPRVNGYRIYRAAGRYDGEYELLGETGSTERSFRDTTSIAGSAYYYYLVAVGDSLSSNRYYTQTYLPAYRTPVGVEEAPNGLPKVFFLDKNYPNPFNPSTTIRYGLPERSRVILTVFNTLGQQVALLAEEEQAAGYHNVRFDATGLSSGVYFYRLTAGTFVQTRKLLLLR